MPETDVTVGEVLLKALDEGIITKEDLEDLQDESLEDVINTLTSTISALGKDYRSLFREWGIAQAGRHYGTTREAALQAALGRDMEEEHERRLSARIEDQISNLRAGENRFIVFTLDVDDVAIEVATYYRSLGWSVVASSSRLPIHHLEFS